MPCMVKPKMFSVRSMVSCEDTPREMEVSGFLGFATHEGEWGAGDGAPGVGGVGLQGLGVAGWEV